MARLKCKMCKVKRKLWEYENFFGVKCRTHFVPLIVLNEHRNKLTTDEKKAVLKIIKTKYPKLYIDDTISDSDEHWHIHLSKKNKLAKI
jgi:hypothetical protein